MLSVAAVRADHAPGVGLGVGPGTPSAGDRRGQGKKGGIVAHVSLQHRDKRVFGRVVAEKVGDGLVEAEPLGQLLEVVEVYRAGG